MHQLRCFPLRISRLLPHIAMHEVTGRMAAAVWRERVTT